MRIEDDNLEHFLALRLGPELARILGSALVHGIYAADSRQLSVRAAFPSLWNAATHGRGSIARGMLVRSSRSASTAGGTYQFGSVKDIMQDVSVYSFRHGMTTLVEALASALKHQSNVRLITGDSAVRFVKNDQKQSITVRITKELLFDNKSC